MNLATCFQSVYMGHACAACLTPRNGGVGLLYYQQQDTKQIVLSLFYKLICLLACFDLKEFEICPFLMQLDHERIKYDVYIFC